MHISEGVLSAPALIGGASAAAAGIGFGIKKIKDEDLPKVAVLSSALFVASLIHIPLGPASVHLILNGLAGLILGWSVFPALFLALLLQAILFQFGGLTTLGVNTLTMGLPAILCFYLFSKSMRSKSDVLAIISGFLTGVLGVFLASILVALFLVTTGEAFLNVAKLVIIAHIPVMILEGIITSFIIVVIKKIRPEILGGVE
jgi:cobalt/nickel transport system permease protein